MWSSLKNYSDGALLVVRVALASLIIWLHGWPKLAGGAGVWKSFARKELGLTLFPAVWGFMGAMAETVGCALMILGLFFRPSVLSLILTFGLVAFVDLRSGGLRSAAHPLELTLMFIAFLFIGPGRFSIDKG